VVSTSSEVPPASLVVTEVPRLVQNELSPILMQKEMPTTKPIAIISAGTAGIAPIKDLLDVANQSLPIKGKLNFVWSYH
jgi:hypothetical protein